MGGPRRDYAGTHSRRVASSERGIDDDIAVFLRTLVGAAVHAPELAPGRRSPRLRRATFACDRERRLERETGFEPATSTLARSHSTTELFPPEPSKYHTAGVAFKTDGRARTSYRATGAR